MIPCDNDLNSVETLKLTHSLLWTIQSNLPLVDLLYSEDLVIAETFLWNQPNHGQNLMQKALYSGHYYSGKLL